MKGDAMGTNRTHSWRGKCRKILIGNPEVYRPPGRPRRRWDDNIKNVH